MRIKRSSIYPTRSQIVVVRSLLILAAFTLPARAVGEQLAANLATQIRELASRHNFTVQGLDKLSDTPAKQVEGLPRERLEVLLSAFNYVLLTDDSGHINKVLITSRKQPEGDSYQGINVKTSRRGSHHSVRATLVGPAGSPQTLVLLVDTGASMIVLPESMSKALGFSDRDLRDGWSQTANGKVRTKQGFLRSVRVGQAIVKDVGVNFIDDSALGGAPLLGMSFLRQYRVTIDDKNNRLILMAR